MIDFLNLKMLPLQIIELTKCMYLTFKILDKDEQTANLIEYRICDLEDFYGELEEKLDDKTRKILDDVL